jgi:hypothetical protein
MADNTNAERQRRYIARLKAGGAGKPVSNAGAEKKIAELQAEVARLKQRAEAAEAEVVKLKGGVLLREIERDVHGVSNAKPKPIWTKAQYMQIVKCLHPDRINGVSADELHAALLLLDQFKPRLVMGEAEERTRKKRAKQAAARKAAKAAKR